MAATKKNEKDAVVLPDLQPPNPNEIFRVSTIGETLCDTLDELFVSGKLTGELANKILQTFDEKMPKVLADNTLVKERISFKGKLGKTYKKFNDFCSIDGENVTIKLEKGNTFELEKLRIMAKEAKRHT